MTSKDVPARKVPGATAFTLVEIIAVLILIGILSAVALTYLRTNDLDIYSQTAAIKNHIRFAQSLAMKQGRNIGAVCNGTSFWLFAGNNTASRLSLPDGSGDTANLANMGVSLTAFTVCFDAWGRPYTSVAMTTLWSAGNNPITVSSTKSSATLSFSITTDTGYIP